jgi:hypothetical protein
VEYKVIIGWDEQNQRYFVVESDVEGLWLEKPSFEALVEAIRDVAGHLLEHNHGEQVGTPTLRIFREIGAPVPVGLGA